MYPGSYPRNMIVCAIAYPVTKDVPNCNDHQNNWVNICYA